MNAINQNLLGIISLVLGGISIIVSIIVTIKNLVRIELKVHYSNIREVSKLSDTNRNVVVSYNNNIVQRVTTTQIRLWNNGKKPIKKEDIPHNDRLKIRLLDSSVRNINILDYSILTKTKSNSNININSTSNSSSLEIEFDYFDYRDGVFFEIQHDGTNNTKVTLDGVILGPKKNTKIVQGKIYDTRDPKQLSKRKKALFLTLLFIIIIPLISVVLTVSPFSYQSLTEEILSNQKVEKIISYYNLSDESVKILKESIRQDLANKSLEDFLYLFIGMIAIGILIFILVYERKYPKELDIELPT